MDFSYEIEQKDSVLFVRTASNVDVYMVSYSVHNLAFVNFCLKLCPLQLCQSS